MMRTMNIIFLITIYIQKQRLYLESYPRINEISHRVTRNLMHKNPKMNISNTIC